MAQHEIAIYEEIGGDFFGGLTAKMFKEQFDSLKAGPGDEILVRINSPGGSVWDGLPMYNLLRESKAKKIVQIDGIALSCAAVIAMAGDEVRMAANGMIMIHNAWSVSMGDHRQMRKDADMIEKTNDSLRPIFSGKTGKRVSTIATLMDAETWLNAEEAKAEGFVDTITDNMKHAKAKFDMMAFAKAPDWVKEQMKDAEPVHWRRLLAKRRLDLDREISKVI